MEKEKNEEYLQDIALLFQQLASSPDGNQQFLSPEYHEIIKNLIDTIAVTITKRKDEKTKPLDKPSSSKGMGLSSSSSSILQRLKHVKKSLQKMIKHSLFPEEKDYFRDESTSKQSATTTPLPMIPSMTSHPSIVSSGQIGIYRPSSSTVYSPDSRVSDTPSIISSCVPSTIPILATSASQFDGNPSRTGTITSFMKPNSPLETTDGSIRTKSTSSSTSSSTDSKYLFTHTICTPVASVTSKLARNPSSNLSSNPSKTKKYQLKQSITTACEPRSISFKRVPDDRLGDRLADRLDGRLADRLDGRLEKISEEQEQGNHKQKGSVITPFTSSDNNNLLSTGAGAGSEMVEQKSSSLTLLSSTQSSTEQPILHALHPRQYIDDSVVRSRSLGALGTSHRNASIFSSCHTPSVNNNRCVDLVAVDSEEDICCGSERPFETTNAEDEDAHEHEEEDEEHEHEHSKQEEEAEENRGNHDYQTVSFQTQNPILESEKEEEEDQEHEHEGDGKGEEEMFEKELLLPRDSRSSRLFLQHQPSTSASTSSSVPIVDRDSKDYFFFNRLQSTRGAMGGSSVVSGATEQLFFSAGGSSKSPKSYHSSYPQMFSELGTTGVGTGSVGTGSVGTTGSGSIFASSPRHLVSRAPSRVVTPFDMVLDEKDDEKDEKDMEKHRSSITTTEQLTAEQLTAVAAGITFGASSNTHSSIPSTTCSSASSRRGHERILLSRDSTMNNRSASPPVRRDNSPSIPFSRSEGEDIIR
ncbi:hypothetical protein ADUPG1_008757 [Aduncisulcus paluster]|uniref:Uncharacterized protein n=1 Tax=Aduncisulcus paluster TaxID=2918883 RepID=A0ABQ5KT44_9EUKA|nr:hypothetical protein ADUPG1_008757 [Aduncisulcus paluster]